MVMQLAQDDCFADQIKPTIGTFGTDFLGCMAENLSRSKYLSRLKKRVSTDTECTLYLVDKVNNRIGELHIQKSGSGALWEVTAKLGDVVLWSDQCVLSDAFRDVASKLRH